MPNIIVPKERIYQYRVLKNGTLVNRPMEFKSDKSKLERQMKRHLEQEFKKHK